MERSIWDRSGDDEGGGSGRRGPRSTEGERRDLSEDLPGETPPEVEAIRERGREAWEPFLRRYSPFLLGCIRRLARDRDERMDMYVHVCRRLYTDDCRRIKQFRGRGPNGLCKFTTWLAAVTFNLGREWIRASKGRRRLFRAIRRLPRQDQLVFRYHYWEGFESPEIAELLEAHHGMEASAEEVESILGRLRRKLSRDQLWRLFVSGLQQVAPVSLDQPRMFLREDSGTEVSAHVPDPEEISARKRAVERLKEAIARLPGEQRRMLELKFGHDMTAKQVAEELGIGNYKRVYEVQGRALARLARELKADGLELVDFRPDCSCQGVLE